MKHIKDYVEHSIALYYDRDKGHKHIHQKTDWKLGFALVYVIYVISGIITTLVSGYKGRELIGGVLGSVFGSLVLLLVITFVGYSFLHLLLKIFGGKAKYFDTLKFSLSLAVFPALLGLLFSFIPENRFVDIMSSFLAIFYVLISLVFFLWVFIVSVLTYAKLHDMRIGKTVLAMLIPMIVLFSIGVLVAVISILILSSSLFANPIPLG